MAMTAKEFFECNKDILVQRITLEEFQSLTDGTVVFGITVARGNTPLEDRQIRTVGYHMVAATHTEWHELPEEKGKYARTFHIDSLTLTTGGHAKVEYTSQDDVTEFGTKLFYTCKPLPMGDLRKNHRWNIWTQEEC